MGLLDFLNRLGLNSGFLEANDLLVCFGGVTNFELQPTPLAFNGT